MSAKLPHGFKRRRDGAYYRQGSRSYVASYIGGGPPFVAFSELSRDHLRDEFGRPLQFGMVAKAIKKLMESEKPHV